MKYDYVEIGGIKWATMNVGAENVTDCGFRFRWGNTKEELRDGDEGDYIDNALTKYNDEDNKKELDAEDDAVTANWGDEWRTPTMDEFVTLGNSTNSAWTENYQDSGIRGLVLTDKSDESKVLFFPTNEGSYGCYWSKSLYGNNRFAYHMHSNSTYVNYHSEMNRYGKYFVRGVLC